VVGAVVAYGRAARSQGDRAYAPLTELGATHRRVFHLQAVHFEDCQGISVKGITLQNSQSYHLTFTRSSNVEANYLRVTSPEDSIDTKGIHLVDSFNVHVMDNLISTGTYVPFLLVPFLSVRHHGQFQQ
jgi:polygalacturonase